MTTRLGAVAVYPVKSMAGVALDAAGVEPRGLEHDRRWMVVDPDGTFVTGRERPRIALARPAVRAAGLRLDAPGMPVLDVPVPGAGAPRRTVIVWGDEVEAVDAGPDAAGWLGRFLGIRCRLVHMPATSRRRVDPDYARPDDEVSFADGFPLLLTATASLVDLERRAGEPLSMRRFRPNVVVEGTPPFAEDGWRRLRIGAIEFEAAKACARCAFTTIDPDTAEQHPRSEPLRTLATFRRHADGVRFGMNLVPRGAGTIRVGDAIEVLG